MSNVKDTIEAVQGIIEAVPVYEDMLQPATKELGKGLLTISKTINIALAPLNGLVWGYDRIARLIETSMAVKLKDIPENQITTPDPSVAVPAIEALRYTAHKEELREMFINLLATSMNNESLMKAHPSFVEIIKQINSDEAKIIKFLNHDNPISIIKVRLLELDVEHYAEPLRNFSLLPFQANCDHVNLGESYLDNIERLKLATITYDAYNTNQNAYDDLTNHPTVKYWENLSPSLNKRFEIKRGVIERTNFGKKFYEACIQE